MLLSNSVNGAPLMYRVVVDRVTPPVFGISAWAPIDRMCRRSTSLGARHLSRLKSVRTWYVFLSAWLLAARRERAKGQNRSSVFHLRPPHVRFVGERRAA